MLVLGVALLFVFWPLFLMLVGGGGVDIRGVPDASSRPSLRVRRATLRARQVDGSIDAEYTERSTPDDVQ
jgi:hypothetical protein